MELLAVKDLVFRAGEKTILDGLTLSVATGEVLALLGPNGTGKSTLAYLLMGCEGYSPASGEVLLDGEDLLPLSLHQRARKGISLAWQEPVRFEGLPVRGYIALGGRAADPDALLAAVGLEPAAYLDRMADRSLSGGERKRIELASLLGLPLRLAILDEPDSGIDMLSLSDIVGVIAAFRARGVSVLLITHREEIALTADRAAQICRGRIEISGSPREVAEYFKSRRCVLCGGEVCAGG